MNSYPDDWKLIEWKEKNSAIIKFFRKNIGIKHLNSKGKYSELVYLTISYVPDGINGLPSKADNDVLYNFEELTLPLIEKDSDCIHVASVVGNGIKDHLIYISNAQRFLNSLNKNNDKLKGLKVSLEKVSDEGWGIYQDFPE